MSAPVKLYVYDLSNGMARSMSLQLTGRQIDGIWHTSVVVFGKEIFYGQGISITQPGMSHHGTPTQVVDVGETAIDEPTFTEYLVEMREHYTADKYHLLDFNCNSFTNDVVGFLTGGSIPAWIKDLPQDFLSTPFGAALRPTIDAMFTRPTPGAAPSRPSFPTAPSNGLLDAVASRAAAPAPQPAPLAATQSLTGSLHLATNPASLNSLLSTHRAVAVFFTSATCAPCRIVAPVFEDLAQSKGNRPGLAFAKVDMAVGRGGEVGAMHGVRVTPSFLFFLDGKKIHELKGADANELRTQVDLLIFQAYPPHPHQSLSLPATRSLSLKPILFTQVPPYATLGSKLTTSVSAANAPKDSGSVITASVIPYLETRFPSDKNKPPATNGVANGTTGKATKPKPTIPVKTLLPGWNKATTALASSAIPPAELFPLADVWRLAVLDDAVSGWCAALPPSTSDPLLTLLEKALLAVGDGASAYPRNFVLTTLRLLANGFGNAMLGRRLLMPGAGGAREKVTALLVPTLLSTDADPSVRTAAASLAFNVAAVIQKARNDDASSGPALEGEDDGDWEVELVSAVVEAIEREKQSEEIVHRLVASLALLLHLSPSYATHGQPVLEVLQARSMLQAKLSAGEKGLEKKEVRKLVAEVAERLCA